MCGKTYNKLLKNLPSPTSTHLQPPGTHTHKPATAKRLNIPKNLQHQHPTSTTEIYIFSLLLYILSRKTKTKRKTIPQAYSSQTQPCTFLLSVDKLWATSKSHRVCNCFNLFPFSGGDFSHSQEINIKYCLQHNPLASPGVLLCRMRPTEQRVTEQMAESLHKKIPIIEGIEYCM